MCRVMVTMSASPSPTIRRSTGPTSLSCFASTCNPHALIMSSCCGATDDIANEFEKIPYGPYIIFGSIDERNYNEYAVAWTILYNLFKTKGVHRDVAMEALRAIRAIAHNNFRYLRWKDDKKEYVQYPPEGRRFVVMEKKLKAK